MILAAKIPTDAERFVASGERDALAGNYCRSEDGHLDFLIQATQTRYPVVVKYLSVSTFRGVRTCDARAVALTIQRGCSSR